MAETTPLRFEPDIIFSEAPAGVLMSPEEAASELQNRYKLHPEDNVDFLLRIPEEAHLLRGLAIIIKRGEPTSFPLVQAQLRIHDARKAPNLDAMAKSLGIARNVFGEEYDLAVESLRRSKRRKLPQ